MMEDMALSGGLVQRLHALAPHPPAAQAEVDRAEAVLGMPLPEPLRDLYLLVGNGGFGPGYGLLGLGAGATDDLGKTALDTYEVFMQPDPDAPPDAGPWWKPAFLPLCYWGCIVYTAVDCRTPDARVQGFDEGVWMEDGRPLVTWLQ